MVKTYVPATRKTTCHDFKVGDIIVLEEGPDMWKCAVITAETAIPQCPVPHTYEALAGKSNGETRLLPPKAGDLVKVPGSTTEGIMLGLLLLDEPPMQTPTLPVSVINVTN